MRFSHVSGVTSQTALTLRPPRSFARRLARPWKRLTEIVLGPGEVVCPVIEEPYRSDAASREMLVARMRQVDLICVFRCASLPPPHVRRRRWPGLSGSDALGLADELISQLLGRDAVGSRAPITVRRYRARVWLRLRDVIELSVDGHADPRATTAPSILLRLVETG